WVDDTIHPIGELCAEVIAIAKGATVEERPFVLPETALDAGLGVGLTADSGGTDAVVRREGEIARVVDRLGPLPPEHDGLLAVVLARGGVAAEAREGALVTVHQREEIDRAEGVEELPLGEDQDVREELQDLRAPVGVRHLVRRPVALGHLAGPEYRRLETRRRTGGRAHAPHVFLDARVSAGESLVLQDLPHPLRGDVGVARALPCTLRILRMVFRLTPSARVMARRLIPCVVRMAT